MTHFQSNMAWYLTQLKPNSHRIAQRNLLRQGFKTFMPLHDETRRVRTAFVTKPRPLFPGYLFVALDVAGAGWRAVNSTLGVARLVAFGSLPTPVPDELVAMLIARCNVDGRLHAAPPLEPGDEVRLVHGPFADFVATVERTDPDRRIWLLLDIMGRKTRMAAHAEDLQVW